MIIIKSNSLLFYDWIGMIEWIILIGWNLWLFEMYVLIDVNVNNCEMVNKFLHILLFKY